MVKYAFATEEQRELAEGAYKIVKNELEPRIEEYELADGGLGVYPMDVHQTLVEAGYFALSIPEEWGGLGMDMVTQGLIIEEIGKVDAGFAFAFAGSGCYFDRILATKMPDEEKQMWADKILAGAMGTFCLTEPEAGSDAAALKTTAVYDEKTDEWIINGTKCFASNAPNAEYFIIFAWTDKSKRASQGVSAFFVEKDRGVQLGKKENKMGLHLSETSDVILDNVRVPADHMIGEPGKGFGMALGGISGAGAIVNCAPLLGMSQACIEQAVEYTQQRRQFGSRVVDFQAVGFMIADMEMRTQACRSMVYDALRAADEGVKTNLDLCIKAYTSDCTMQTALDTVQVMGGYGYMKEYPAERWMLNNGCEGAENSAELFAKSDFIMISMPTSRQVEMNMYGEEGILANARPGTVVIDLTSGDASVTQKLCKECAEKGIEMIDAPVSGGQKGATEQTLAVMVGGSKETFEKAKHILETIGNPEKVTYMGPSGAGDAMKCINNYVSCTNFLATAEALSVAVKAGIDPRVACSVIQNSGGQSNATAYKFPSLIFKGNPMSMAVDLMMKDIALYNSLAKDIKVPSMYGNLSFQMFNILSSSGRGMEDFSNVARLYEEWSGAKLWEVDKD